MTDFKNNNIFHVKQTNKDEGGKLARELLTDSEKIEYCFHDARDFVIFTNRRIILVDIQGMTGKRRDFTFLSYSKILAYSIETAGVLDFDCELKIWFNGVGILTFEISAKDSIAQICKVIASYIP